MLRRKTNADSGPEGKDIAKQEDTFGEGTLAKPKGWRSYMGIGRWDDNKVPRTVLIFGMKLFGGLIVIPQKFMILIFVINMLCKREVFLNEIS